MNYWGVRLNRYRDLAVLIAKSPRGDQFLGQVKVASTGWQRLMGWRNRGLCLGVWLIPCNSIHTFGMRESIDLLWLNRDRQLIAIDSAVRPTSCRYRHDAYSVIELPVGVLAGHGFIEYYKDAIT